MGLDCSVRGLQEAVLRKADVVVCARICAFEGVRVREQRGTRQQGEEDKEGWAQTAKKRTRQLSGRAARTREAAAGERVRSARSGESQRSGAKAGAAGARRALGQLVCEHSPAGRPAGQPSAHLLLTSRSSPQPRLTGIKWHMVNPPPQLLLPFRRCGAARRPQAHPRCFWAVAARTCCGRCAGRAGGHQRLESFPKSLRTPSLLQVCATSTNLAKLCLLFYLNRYKIPMRNKEIYAISLTGKLVK